MRSFARREATRLLSRGNTAYTTSIPATRRTNPCIQGQRRAFHGSRKLLVVKPYLLADIGEGITECQVIQWFVKPGARVEQFDPICEVQSDKASVEITSRFDGVIKRLYYEPDDMAKVGKPLVDIDIQSEISAADEALLNGSSDKEAKQDTAQQPEPQGQELEVSRNDTKASLGDTPLPEQASPLPPNPRTDEFKAQRQPGKHASLATPAVRHLVKEHKLKIEDIDGTGKEGRVLKGDVQRHAQAATQTTSASATSTPTPPSFRQTIEDRVQPLTPVQSGMFKQMTKSLSIPHFLYTDAVDFSSLTFMRKRYNVGREKSERITPLPIIVKAVSLTLQHFPLLNSHLDTTSNPAKPQIILKGSHNIGIAVDSPSGLLVPVIKNVQDLSITAISQEITRLATLARNGKLSSADLTGATFTVSNIGSIGGTAVAPVIVTPQVGIVGIGKARVVPAFSENGELIKREECVFSWSADHRVVDGAYVARAAEEVRSCVEGVEGMLMRMR
ncbi:2-oxoacid dehydrogenases acyltransferase-domain-containing protein [Ampelomyces quisqualis]|uniref:Dihydrolipoamide acetyltransferase component of pyruvate dehydrogenase complex n=1 Tax=Ampelomyces quisqualis TaxID=50730 RepID=A0A6A5Q8Z9_AMPQU|nr:2-oxoacid dehydrogenases acyltransferase-domain-containing protein [Ampelomyces quisqualis]